MRFTRRKIEIDKLQEQIFNLEKQNKNLLDKLSSFLSGNTGIDWNAEVFWAAVELENLGLGIYYPDGDYVKFSPGAINLLGLKTENNESRLDTFLAMVSAEDRAIMQKSFNEALNSDKIQCFDFKLIRSDQDREIRYIASKCKRIILKDDKKQIIFTLLDVTKQEKTRRELLRAKERAEESDRFKNIFLSNISREIRIPMNSIVGFAELLNIEGVSPEDRVEYLKIIKNQSNHLLKLIDDISEIARFEAGEVKINRSVCNLNLLLNELLGNFNQEKKIQKKEQLNLKIVVPQGKGLTCYTDSGRLQQLLSNLISNAVKFTEKGSVEFGYSDKDESFIEFFVKDTGIGLTKEEQKQIFDRFRFNEETITKKYEGSGLGLSIAKGIVKLLGGKIWIESEPGNGTTMFFTIAFEHVPEEDISQVIDEEEAQQSFNWKDKLILVVEDDDVNYKFIETVLLENQAQVIWAHNGLQAIELCKSINKIELILMDIKMPEMDGFEATRKIKQLFKNIPIIAQTAFALPEDKEKCLEAGCDDHIIKPIDVKDMLQKINKFFSR